LIEYLAGSELGLVVKKYFENLKPDERVYCSLYAVSETFYVLCRMKGLEHARDDMDRIYRSRVIEIGSTAEMALEAGRIKCERAISVADCSCIATAKLTNSQAVFAQREKELKEEIGRKVFDTNLVFLSDLTSE
jgi:predicted nucleic acid-binding protein